MIEIVYAYKKYSFNILLMCYQELTNIISGFSREQPIPPGKGQHVLCPHGQRNGRGGEEVAVCVVWKDVQAKRRYS